MFETPKTNRTSIWTVLGITIVSLSLVLFSSAFVPAKGQPQRGRAQRLSAAFGRADGQR